MRQALADPEIAQEIVAELSNESGNTLLQGPLLLSYAEQRRILEEAIACYTSAMNVYSYTHYPLQYARTCMYLGAAYQRYGILLNAQEAIEKALTYYQSALWIYNRKEHPEQWSLLQTLMGKTYAARRVGGIQNNLDYAAFCHEAALLGLQQEEYPEVWARAQANLGDVYLLRQQRGYPANLAKALICYQGALRVYTQQAFPKEWADMHAKLATVFQKMASQDEQQSDTLQSCSIVCCEVALKVYTADAYAVEYATTQFCLGKTHAMRIADRRDGHLEQAIKCYREALHIFTSERFPAEHQQVSMHVVEAKAAGESK